MTAIASEADLQVISIAARSSPLSQAQVKEVLAAIQLDYPNVSFDSTFVESTGDKDLQTSLRVLGKTDFFTQEVDHLILESRCQIGIHSAKDLPEPLTQGLTCIALTQGVDSADSLVFRKNESLKTLPKGAIVATSSERREEIVKRLRSDLKFIDIRGTIHKRLEALHNGMADAVVIAEAALIRLQLTHLSRLKLPGPTTPYQGQLAIIARTDNLEMRDLFRSLDTRSLENNQ
jgi:hydroxymethylbilane synthase